MISQTCSQFSSEPAPAKPIRLLSWLLILWGGVLLGAGACDFSASLFGQRQAAGDWQSGPRAPALGAVIARVSIPRLDAAWFVMEGAGQNQLRLGPGHMPGTARPGDVGNCVIAGHRDTHFRALKDIRKGDEIRVETSTGRFCYRVTGISIVKPSNVQALAPSTPAVLSLVTCYPFYYVGPAPRRFVVRAAREPAAIAHLAAGARRSS